MVEPWRAVLIVIGAFLLSCVSSIDKQESPGNLTFALLGGALSLFLGLAKFHIG